MVSAKSLVLASPLWGTAPGEKALALWAVSAAKVAAVEIFMIVDLVFYFIYYYFLLTVSCGDVGDLVTIFSET